MLVCAEFQKWCARKNLDSPTGNDGFLFYLEHEKMNSALLNFDCNGDRWQTVHAWLLGAKLVSD